MEKYKFLNHTADIKFQAFGKTVSEAFGNSAYALFNSMYKGKVRKGRKIELEVEGHDLISLLYNFLEELVFYLDSENFFLSKVEKIKVDSKKFKLGATLVGDDAKNYSIGLDVKAVTYNEMIVLKKDENWVCQGVLDV